MNNKTFPRLACVFMMCFTFFLLPFNAVYADGYSTDSDFWRWWYIEHTTDEITNGSGASAENIQNTDNGQTAGTVIYNQSGVTRGDFIDYVEEQYNQAEGYIQKGVDYYVDAVNHVYDSTVTTATKAAYQTEKAVREVVDSTGKVIVDVSGSDFWHSVYNGLFNNNGYKTQYTEQHEGVSVNFDNGSVVIINIDYGDRSYSWEYNGATDSVANNFLKYPENYCLQYRTTLESNKIIPLFKITLNTTYGNTIVYHPWTNFHSEAITAFNNGGIKISEVTYSPNGNVIYYKWGYNNTYPYSGTIYIKESVFENVTNNVTQIPQPSQCGFIVYNGDRVPVYTDPSQNPFTINDDGTVDYNGNTFPIYIESDPISPEGWLKILEYIDNQDQTENPYNPQGKPWNTQDDGTVLGGWFSDLVSDISSVIEGLKSQLNSIINDLLDKIKNILKSLEDLIKGIFIPDEFDFSQLFDFEIDDNFGLIQQIIEYFLQAVGVTST